jgi:hypothetical protein
MPKRDDYVLTIEEVARRLNKSIRTVHRYKDNGRLTFQVGATQGNPLYFSRSEVEGLARELYPHLPVAAVAPDPMLWERLDRVERLLGVLESNPLLERLLAPTAHVDGNGSASRSDAEATLRELAGLERDGHPVDRHELGRILVRLGNTLLNS